MSDDSPLLLARRATRRFGFRTVVRDVELSVARGNVVTLIGPNGAGKTTLLKMLAGLIRPTSGAIERFGTIDAVLHQSLLYEELTARENLTFAGRLIGRIDRARIDAMLDYVGLTDARDQRVESFSRGMQQRLSFARALLHDPDVLLLDEPLNSLDEQGAQLVLDLLSNGSGRRRATVVVTHQIERLFDVTTSVGYLVGGMLHGPTSVDGLTSTAVTQQLRSMIARV